MKKSRHLLFCFLLLLVACLAGCQKKTTPNLSPQQLLPALKEVGKLELLEISTEEVFIISGSGHTLFSVRTLEEASEYLTDLLRVGERKGVYSFTNYSIAYLNLSELTTESVTFSNGVLHLSLPPIAIEPIGRSGTLTELHERVSGSKAPITNAERTKMQNRASELAKERLAPSTTSYRTLVEQAEARAVAFFTGYFHSRGYDQVTITIERREEL